MCSLGERADKSVATADGLTDAAPEIGEEVRLIMLSSWLDSDHLP